MFSENGINQKANYQATKISNKHEDPATSHPLCTIFFIQLTTIIVQTLETEFRINEFHNEFNFMPTKQLTRPE